MDLRRRAFLKLLAGTAGATAAGLVLPEVEPVRRWWQVGRGAPVGGLVSVAHPTPVPITLTMDVRYEPPAFDPMAELRSDLERFAGMPLSARAEHDLKHTVMARVRDWEDRGYVVKDFSVEAHVTGRESLIVGLPQLHPPPVRIESIGDFDRAFAMDSQHPIRLGAIEALERAREPIAAYRIDEG